MGIRAGFRHWLQPYKREIALIEEPGILKKENAFSIFTQHQFINPLKNDVIRPSNQNIVEKVNMHYEEDAERDAMYAGYFSCSIS